MYLVNEHSQRAISHTATVLSHARMRTSCVCVWQMKTVLRPPLAFPNLSNTMDLNYHAKKVANSADLLPNTTPPADHKWSRNIYKDEMKPWIAWLVGIATRYGLGGPRIQSPGGGDFPHLSRPALGPTQPPIQWLPGHSQSKSAEAWRYHPPHLTSRLQEELSYTVTAPRGLHGLFCGYLYLYLYYKHVMTSMQQFITRTIIISTTVTIKDWQKPADKKKNTINQVAKRQVKYCSNLCALLQL